MILIMCPTSRSSKGKKLWQGWTNRLDAAGVKYECRQTEYPGHASEIARSADSDVAAVGGDGTINEVINGVMGSAKQKKMGILYCGTSPDFCRFHHIPTSPQKAVDVLLNGKTKFIDVAKIEYHGKDNLRQTGFFASSCNIGMGASVAMFANRHRKIFGDLLGTMLGVVRAIAAHKPVDIEMLIDGRSHKIQKCDHLVIIKNPFIASGLKLNLDISPDDGRGFVLAIYGKRRPQLLSMLPEFYTGRITERNDIFLKPFTTLELTAANPVEIEFDGDPKGRLPVKVEILTRSIELIGAENA